MSTHTDTEKMRLDIGIENCGCPECQRFYKTIDLKKYGGRVKTYGDIIFIAPKNSKPETTTGTKGHVAQGKKGVRTPPDKGKPVDFDCSASKTISSCEKEHILAKRVFNPSFKKIYPQQAEKLF